MEQHTEILIVPDVHGRDFWLPALAYPGEIIFLGDYADPYPQEGISAGRAFENFQIILDFKKANPGNVTLLIGNHELHYYDSSYRSSRFSFEYYEKYHEILTSDSYRDFFQLCKQTGDCLFIHAGLLKGWYDLHFDEFKHLGDTLEEQINRFFEQNKEAFYEVSSLRGGLHDFGSPIWADIQEHQVEKEHYPPNLIQIIGHTQLMSKTYFSQGNIRLLDNRKLYLLKDQEIMDYKPGMNL
jgi:hypothetical protein